MFSRYQDSLEVGLNAAMAIQFLMNFSMSLALTSILNLIESLQFVSFTLLMNFDLPAHVVAFKQIFLLFLNADVL